MPKIIKIKADCMDRLVSEHGFILNENLEHIEFVGFYKPYMNNARYYTYIDNETGYILGEVCDE